MLARPRRPSHPRETSGSALAGFSLPQLNWTTTDIRDARELEAFERMATANRLESLRSACGAPTAWCSQRLARGDHPFELATRLARPAPTSTAELSETEPSCARKSCFQASPNLASNSISICACFSNHARSVLITWLQNGLPEPYGLSQAVQSAQSCLSGGLYSDTPRFRAAEI